MHQEVAAAAAAVAAAAAAAAATFAAAAAVAPSVYRLADTATDFFLTSFTCSYPPS